MEGGNTITTENGNLFPLPNSDLDKVSLYVLYQAYIEWPWQDYLPRVDEASLIQ